MCNDMRSASLVKLKHMFTHDFNMDFRSVDKSFKQLCDLVFMQDYWDLIFYALTFAGS